MTSIGTVEGLRAHMIRAHGIQAPDAALDFALRRARSYSGSEAGVYAVATKWVRAAAEGVCPACMGEPLPPTHGPDGRPILGVCAVCSPLPAHVQALVDAE